MSVNYNRVKYYNLGRPYFDTKVVPSRPPEVFEILEYSTYPLTQQKYYRTTNIFEIQGRSPYVATNDVVCDTTTYLTYLSEDEKYIFIKFKNSFNGALSYYALTYTLTPYLSVINWLNCGDVVDVSKLQYTTLCVLSGGGGGCEFVEEYNGFYYPRNGTSQVLGANMTIRYIS